MAAPQSRSARITVINDSPEFLELMHGLLEEQSGYEVSIIEGDRVESLQPIRATRPDLIIIDLRLIGGRLSGWDILSQLQDDAELRDVPVLICTADQDALRRREPELAEMPRLSTMLKPFTIGELERKVKSLLA